MYNDTYGHETGDKVLIKAVKIIQKVLRDDDCICRIGGDEFVVFLLHTAGISRELPVKKERQRFLYLL